MYDAPRCKKNVVIYFLHSLISWCELVYRNKKRDVSVIANTADLTYYMIGFTLIFNRVLCTL